MPHLSIHILQRGILVRSLRSIGFACVFLTFIFLCSCSKSFVVKESDKNKSRSNWTQFGRKPERTGFATTTVTPPLENIWTYSATSAIGPSLLAVDGLIYLSTLDGRIDVIDVVTGARLKRTKLDEQLEGTLAYFAGDLFIASRYGDKTLGRLDLGTGNYVWQIDAGDIASEPLLTDDGIYVAALYKHIDKYDLQTGEKKWSFETEDQLRSSPALVNETIVVGCDNGIVYALSAATGELKWKTGTGGSVFAAPVVGGSCAYVGATDSVFYAIELENGKILWRFKTESPIYQAAAADDRVVVFGCTDGSFYCLSMETGQQLWRFEAHSIISTAPVISGETIYFGSLDKNYYALNLADGKLVWRFTTQGRVRTSPVIWGDYLIGASENKYLYGFRKQGTPLPNSNEE